MAEPSATARAILGAMQALKEANKKIPEEVAVIGFANEDFGQYVTPALSTIDQQATRMGERKQQRCFSNCLKQIASAKIIRKKDFRARADLPGIQLKKLISISVYDGCK